MNMHRRKSIIERGFKLGTLAAALTLSVSACGDDNEPSGDTINDTAGDVDTDTTDTNVNPDTDTTADTGADTEVTPTAAVVINEVAASGDPADWVELHNPGSTAADISGWVFKDDDDTHAYVLPSGSIIPAGGYKVLVRIDPGQGEGFEFGLGGADSARLYDGDGDLVDETAWADGGSPIAGSWGRIPNATGAFTTLLSPTPGAANVANPAQDCGNDEKEGLEVCDGTDFGSLTCGAYGWGGGTLSCLESCTRIGTTNCTARPVGLVINEVESDEQDRIELYNGSGAAIDLRDFTLTDDGGNTYTIETGSLAAGAYLVLERDVNHLFGLGDADGLTLKDDSGDEIDRVSWAIGQAIPAWCRMPNGTGGFRTCDNQSFGSANF